eukprot:UN02618
MDDVKETLTVSAGSDYWGTAVTNGLDCAYVPQFVCDDIPTCNLNFIAGEVTFQIYMTGCTYDKCDDGHSIRGLQIAVRNVLRNGFRTLSNDPLSVLSVEVIDHDMPGIDTCVYTVSVNTNQPDEP